MANAALMIFCPFADVLNAELVVDMPHRTDVAAVVAPVYVPHCPAISQSPAVNVIVATDTTPVDAGKFVAPGPPVEETYSPTISALDSVAFVIPVTVIVEVKVALPAVMP